MHVSAIAMHVVGMNAKAYSLLRFRISIPHGGGSDTYRLLWTSPMTFKGYAATPLVAQVSPSFLGIYNQALKAQSLRLEDICGPGFRKSLEFLLKEFLLSEPDIKGDSDKEKEVRKLMLGTLLTKYIKDDNLKEVAEGASWMGNDETHFEKRWHEKDVEDLKEAIQLAVNWIDSTLRTRMLKADKVAHNARRRRSTRQAYTSIVCVQDSYALCPDRPPDRHGLGDDDQEGLAEALGAGPFSTSLPLPRWLASSRLKANTILSSLIGASPSKTGRVINARIESALEKPLFKSSAVSHRVIIPATGFFEWTDGRKKKPFYFKRKDGGPLGPGGLWRVSGDIQQCVVLTTTANEVMAPFNDRMAATIKPEDFKTFLGSDPVAALAVATEPFPAELMECYEVTSAMGNSIYQGSDSVTPLLNLFDL